MRPDTVAVGKATQDWPDGSSGSCNIIAASQRDCELDPPTAYHLGSGWLLNIGCHGPAGSFALRKRMHWDMKGQPGSEGLVGGLLLVLPSVP